MQARRSGSISLAVLGLALYAGASQAQNGAGEPPSIASSLGAVGNLGGFRNQLTAKGISFEVVYTGEVLANISGGITRGAIYDGRLDVQLDVDFARLAGIPGFAFHAGFYDIHGRGLSRDNVGNLLTVSNIEALSTARLSELWIEQALFGGRAAIRVGQLAADSEFIVSSTAGLFINGSFGWPDITGANLPAGGPAYPFATPGVRLKIVPTHELTLLAAIFNGDPSGGGGTGDPQSINAHSLNFPVRNAPLLMGEVAYAYNQADGTGGLPGTVKLGGWYHFGLFADQRFGTDGLSLADPASNGLPRQHRGSKGLYAIIDQALFRDGKANGREIDGFLRLAANPADRNQVALYVDGGITLKSPILSRPDDIVGLAFAYARISDRASDLDRDARAVAGGGVVRSGEAVVELTYQAQMLPGWTVQPSVQYVSRPGGGIADPRDPAGGAIRNAIVVLVRSAVRY